MYRPNEPLVDLSLSVEEAEHGSLFRPTKYTCAGCHKGQMTAEVEEGELSYTEHFTCNSCTHQAHIPTNIVLISQLLTALLGLAICLFLINKEYLVLATSAELSANLLQQIPAALLLVTFIVGFGLIFKKSISGFVIRRRYAFSK